MFVSATTIFLSGHIVGISVPYFGTAVRKFGTAVPNNGTEHSCRDKKTFTIVLQGLQRIYTSTRNKPKGRYIKSYSLVV